MRVQIDRLWLCLLVLAVWSAPHAARAQGCECTCPGKFWEIAASERGLGPFTVAPQMPRNARIFAWLAAYEPSTVRLASEEREIAVTVQLATPDVPGAYWITPAEPLRRPGSYTLSVSGPSPAYRYETHFTALDSDDVIAPVTGDPRTTPFRHYASCEDIVGVGFDLDVHENMSPVVFEIEVRRGDVLVGHTFTNAGAFGTSPMPDCFGSMHVDGLVEGERLTARVRVFDSAANASDFVTFSFTPNRALAGSRQPCGGCSAGSTGPQSPIPAWATGLMLLGAAGCRRRWRRGIVTR